MGAEGVARGTAVYHLRSQGGEHDHVRGVRFAGRLSSETLVAALTSARMEWPEAVWVEVTLARVEDES